MKTSFENVITENNGKPLGVVSGLPSYRKGSNTLTEAQRIFDAHPEIDTLTAIAGAHLRQGTQGWYWYFYASTPGLCCPRGRRLDFKKVEVK